MLHPATLPTFERAALAVYQRTYRHCRRCRGTGLAEPIPHLSLVVEFTCIACGHSWRAPKWEPSRRSD